MNKISPIKYSGQMPPPQTQDGYVVQRPSKKALVANGIPITKTIKEPNIVSGIKTNNIQENNWVTSSVAGILKQGNNQNKQQQMQLNNQNIIFQIYNQKIKVNHAVLNSKQNKAKQQKNNAL